MFIGQKSKGRKYQVIYATQKEKKHKKKNVYSQALWDRKTLFLRQIGWRFKWFYDLHEQWSWKIWYLSIED